MRQRTEVREGKRKGFKEEEERKTEEREKEKKSEGRWSEGFSLFPLPSFRL